ncbi:MAG TPA: cobalt-precorrin 5A hydrolase [Desulfitobacteriaceae bacterium]|nr:cobalt-precorrin 5A hydrolase [Desulfitobacteriaceae bacterium]
MKIAVIVLTERGKKTALRLRDCFVVKPDLYLHEHCQSDGLAFSFKHLRQLMPSLWTGYSLLIFIMATGIVVRQISPYLENKAVDPAVLVLDDNGRFIIPLLSGHLGGANAWARYLAPLLPAAPVITTATDGADLIAPDEYARRFNWKVWPLKNLPQINRLLLERGYLTVWTEYLLAESHPLKKDSNYRFLPDQERTRADLIITAFSPTTDSQLFLIPPSLGAGIGCRRGIGTETVLQAVSLALEQAGVSSQALGGLYSIDLKADEKGITEAALILKIPLITFSSDLIQKVNNEQNLAKSELVKDKIGVDGVCEAASILGTQMGELILPKLKLQGITIALSRQKFLSWESDPAIPTI